MSAASFALGIPHTPWRPERVKSLERLQGLLQLSSTSPDPHVYAIVDDREPNWSWSEKLWTWACSTSPTHLLQLQDDVIVPSNFWPALRAMVEAVPDRIIGLEVVHPAAPALARQGHRWCTTSDMLIGVGYVVPMPMLRRFLEWRASLRQEALESITEDTLLATWCVAYDHRIWHPIPTIIDHDTSVPSTYGNDAHQARRPMVRWDNWDGVDMRVTGFWGQASEPLHLGRFYDSIAALALRWDPMFTDAEARAYMADDGRAVKRRLALLERAEAPAEPAARLLLCTPVLGSVRPEYASSVWQLISAEALDVENGFQIEPPIRQADYDLVRVRARFVRMFLESEATHLLFVDGDVSFRPEAIFGMLRSGKDFIACPYPRRAGLDGSSIDFAGVARAEDLRPPEAKAYRYPIRVLPGSTMAIDGTGCVEVAGIGLGCALLSRRCLQRMWLHYADALLFHDRVGAVWHPTVALFMLDWYRGEHHELLSEDHSFCQRWTEMGEKVWMYLGAGSPVDHHGVHAHRGLIEAFGLRRT